jgi:hypothetical protein
LPELFSYERIDEWTKTPNSLNTICQYSHACFAQLPSFCEKEKIVADITSIESFTTIENTHTQVEIQLVIITLQFL